VAGHVYMRDTLSTRLSIKKRGGSLGHHSAMKTQERFFHEWRSERTAELVWSVGSMAAEYAFYGETSTGVGGDLQGVTANAALMVGGAGMGPTRIEFNGRFADDAEEERERRRVMRKFEELGAQLMNRASSGSALQGDPIASVMGDPVKRSMVAQLIGQAFVTAYWLVDHNREAVERVADTLLERRELFGDEVVDLLDSVAMKIPDVDILDDEKWPRL
jgi:cell division protease FtsH